MSTLEKIMQYKEQNLSDQEIVQSLLREGVSPKEINEALSQSRIKSMISKEDEEEYPDVTNDNYPSMQPSIMPPEESEDHQLNPGISQIQEQSEIPSSYNPQIEPYQGQQDQYQYSQNGEYQDYPEYYPEYAPTQNTDIETINDISTQIVEEKTEELKRQMADFINFKSELSFKMDALLTRVDKIEKDFSDLQMAILRRVGEFGDDVKNISKELIATQNTFSKIIDPLTDNIRELEKLTDKINPKPESPPVPSAPKQSNSDKFHNFMR